MTKPILNWFRLTARQRCHILKAAEAYCTPNGAGSEEIASEMYYAVAEAWGVEDLEARQLASEDQVDLREKIARAFWAVNMADATYDEAVAGAMRGNSLDATAILFAKEVANAIFPTVQPRPVTVQEAAKVLVSQTTIAEKKVMNEAGIDAMRPGGFTFADMVDFDTGRIAALRALSETDT